MKSKWFNIIFVPNIVGYPTIASSFFLLVLKEDPSRLTFSKPNTNPGKLVALKIIEKGEKFSKDSIGMRRTENDSIFLESDKVIGHEASRRINRGEIIDEKCIE